MKSHIARRFPVRPLLAAPALIFTATAEITPFATYPLGEPGTLLANTLQPVDQSGSNLNFGREISGATATLGTGAIAPLARNSTAYLDTSGPGDEGWFSSGLFSSLPADNFAFGIFAKASANPANRGDVFALGGSNGSFKLQLDAVGWRATAHNIGYVGDAVPLVPDTWVHLAVIRINGVSSFYVDGVPQGAGYAGAPVHDTAHLSVAPNGANYFDGGLDEARIVTFSADESAPRILAALQAGILERFVRVGAGATANLADLKTDQSSVFRLGGEQQDSITILEAGGLSVIGEPGSVHEIQLEQSGPIAVGVYPLIHYSGAIGGLGFAGLKLGALPSRMSAELVDNATEGVIELHVTAASENSLIWTGAGGSTWNVQLATNWKFSSSGAPATFFPQDSVLLDDSGATGSVTLAGLISPSSVHVANDTLDYTFSGDGIEGTGSLLKTGQGTLTLANDNSYTGLTSIEEGTLVLGNGAALGMLGDGPVDNEGTFAIDRSDESSFASPISGAGLFEKRGTGTIMLGDNGSFSGPIVVKAGILQAGSVTSLGLTTAGTTVESGATLDVNSVGFRREPLTIAGAGVGDLGAIVNTGSPQEQAVISLTLSADSTIGGASRWDVRGPASLERASATGDFELTKVGEGLVCFVNAQVAIREIQIKEGTLAFQFGTTVTDEYPGTIRVQPAAALLFGNFGRSVSCVKPIAIEGGTLGSDDGPNTVDSAIELAGAINTAEVSQGATLSLAGPVSGSGSLKKTGPGLLALTQAPGFSGDLTVEAGTVSLAQAGLADTSTVTLAAEGILDLAFQGPDAIGALVIDGEALAAGVYDATHPVYGAFFKGTGSLAVGGIADPYAAWEAFHGIAGAGAETDSDGDGIPNGIEFVTGGNPAAADSTALLPQLSRNGTELVIAFRRTQQSMSYQPSIEYTTTLDSWTPATDGQGGVTIETTDGPAAGIDQVLVRLPASLANQPRLFIRLRAEIP